MKLRKEEIRRVWDADRHRDRRRLLLLSVIALGAMLFCMSCRYNGFYYTKKLVPAQNFRCLVLWLRLGLSRLGGTELWLRRQEAIEAAGGSIAYLGAVAQFKITLMAFVSGAALSIAGAIFQTAYRNPMASPNILGATAGVQLGNVLVILLFSTAAAEQIYTRYAFTYGFTVLCVLAVLLLGRFTGSSGGHSSILETVMVGSIVSQTLNVVSMYIMYELEDEELLLYQQLILGARTETDTVSVTVFFTVMLLSILPVLLLRYRMNCLGLDQDEAKALGVNNRPFTVLGQVCGIVMTACAMIHFGTVGMLAMVIPYGVREFLGSDFRRVCLGSALLGGTVMMAGKTISSFIVLMSETVPITFIINVMVFPLFIVILIRKSGQPGRDTVET